MTFGEFLEFISQSAGHFIGFLIVIGIIGETIRSVFKSIFKNKKE